MALSKEERTGLINYRLQRSAEVLVEAEDVYKLKHYILAINRLYYATFYAMTALLIKDGHSAITHAGVRGIMGKEYVKTGILSREDGKLFSTLFNMRQSGDYGDSYEITKEDVEEYLTPTKIFIEKIRKLTTVK